MQLFFKNNLFINFSYLFVIVIVSRVSEYKLDISFYFILKLFFSNNDSNGINMVFEKYIQNFSSKSYCIEFVF